jgi:hypothetical protein
MSGTHQRIAARTPGPWTAVTFAGTWVDYGGGFQPVEYRKVGDRVEMRGLAKSGSGTVFTLPAGFRPGSQEIFACDAASNTHARVDVDTSGNVIYQGGGTGATYLSLSGISFSTTA